MDSQNLKDADAEAAAVATAPRVTLEGMEAKIDEAYYIQPYGTSLTLCVLKMRNGFYVVGESAAASLANFDADLGKKFAYENAIRQLWKLEGYSLRDRLAAEGKD